MRRLPTTTNAPVIPVINCNRHQAPNGYKYIYKNGVCIMVRSDTGAPAIAYAGTGFIQGAQQAVMSNYLPSISGVSNWIQSNKGLALVIGLGAAYLLTKK